jgi:hypothetical protein
MRRAAARAAAGRPHAAAKRRNDVDEPVLPRQHRHQHVFGDRLLVAGDVAHGDPGGQRRHVDQIEPRRHRLQQFDPRRCGKILFPDVADDDFGVGQQRDQPLCIVEIEQHRHVELLGGLGEDRLPHPGPRAETAQKHCLHRRSLRFSQPR